MDFKALAAPFPIEEIQWRVGSTYDKGDKIMGMALAYYDARALYDRLDTVCKPENWQIRYPHANGKTCAEIGIKIKDEWIWKSNGAGDTDFEASKGAFSDAAKRAGVPWGIGRYLYEMKNTWVECEQKGKTKIIKESEYAKLNAAYRNFLETGAMPSSVGGYQKSGNKLVDKAVTEALTHIQNCIDADSAKLVGRNHWKLLKEGGASEQQLAIIQDQVENHCTYLSNKGAAH